MATQPKQPYSAVTQSIYLDQPSRAGRRLTVVLLSIAVLLLIGLFLWFGMRRIHLVLVSQADSAYQEQQYDRAAQLYTQALQFDIDRGDTHVLLNRGYAQQRLGNQDAAISDFTHVIELQPQDPAGYIARGNAYVRSGKVQEAIEDFSSAIEYGPNQEALFGRARA